MKGGQGRGGEGELEGRAGFTQREIEALSVAGGKLSLAEALRCRVRYFTAGAVLGSQELGDEFLRGSGAPLRRCGRVAVGG